MLLVCSDVNSLLDVSINNQVRLQGCKCCTGMVNKASPRLHDQAWCILCLSVASSGNLGPTYSNGFNLGIDARVRERLAKLNNRPLQQTDCALYL